MCGIAGFAGAQPGRDTALGAMLRALHHRGPDDHGQWTADDVALGQTRLSIVDLSAAGHQPMVSADGRWVLVFNGEIYNHSVLRAELERAGAAPAWRGHSDTETLLAALGHWGLAATLPRLVGMFALGLWDRAERTLTLARDRLGEKPLYYAPWHGGWVFASEIQALRACPGVTGTVDRGALALLLRHNVIPAPHSIYAGVAKLPPATSLVLRAGAPAPAPVPYWSALDAAQAPRLARSDAEAVDGLERVLTDAVAGQLMGDVPLGAFLSGGVDSSTVVALMQAASGQPVRTFTIGFEDPLYDESAAARAVAKHLGTAHTELRVSAADAQAVIPRLAGVYGEPFADSSQIPTILVAELARRQVTVALSGDGGDELFGGYNRHVLAERLGRPLMATPVALRQGVARALTRVSPAQWNAWLGARQGWLPRGLAQADLGAQLHKAAGILAARDTTALYRGLASHWPDPAAVVIGGAEPPTLLDAPAAAPLADPVERMMLLDLLTYLPDDILVKVDRAAMACSLETRVPLLDHRVVDYAWSLPKHQKLRNGQGKWALRQVLYRHVPRELIERPKQGFGIPLHDWLRGPLRDWAAALLDPARLRREGYFHPEPIQQKWQEHLGGRRNWQHHLWDVLMFQSWLETVGPGAGEA